jgi:hypothetical protein
MNSVPASAPKPMAAQSKIADGAQPSQSSSFASMMKQVGHAGEKPAAAAPQNDATASPRTPEVTIAPSDSTSVADSSANATAASVANTLGNETSDNGSNLSVIDDPQQTTASVAAAINTVKVQPLNNLDSITKLNQDAPAVAVDDSKSVDGKSQAKLHVTDVKAKSVTRRQASDTVANVPAQPGQADTTAAQPMVLAQAAIQNLPVAKNEDAAAKNSSETKTPIARFATSTKNVAMNASTNSVAPQSVMAPVQTDPTKVVAGSSQTTADTDEKEEGNSDQGGALFADKIASAAGVQHSHLFNADAVPQPMAPADVSFRFSLHDVAQTSHAITNNTVHEAVQASAFASDGNAAPQDMPAVRHLEVALNDPMLGNVGIRAEMRNGALHASITGAVNEIATAAPALHQYLQQHNVELHSVSFSTPANNDTRVPQVNAAATTSFSGGMDSSSSNGSGAQPQQQSARTAVPEWKSAFADNSDFNVNRFMTSHVPAAASSMRAGSTLSIHI